MYFAPWGWPVIVIILCVGMLILVADTMRLRRPLERARQANPQEPAPRESPAAFEEAARPPRDMRVVPRRGLRAPCSAHDQG